MVSHTPFQYYRTNVCMQCMTGSLGCRWHRYQQSRRSPRKRDIFWFLFFCCTFCYVTFLFYFWLIAVNDFDDFNWYIYTETDFWYNWYSVIVGLTATVFIYYVILMLLSLCHIFHNHQLYIYPVHLAAICITIAFCVAETIIIQELWSNQWNILYLSLQITGPFLYIGAVAIVTLLSCVIAGQWVRLQSLAARILCIALYASVIIVLYAVPVFINSPCVINDKDLPPKPKVIAHRGASGVAPENTEIAFQFAIDYNASGWESDVRLSRDGVPCLMHDNTLERTTDVKKKYPKRSRHMVSTFTMAELEQLDAGSWFIDDDPMGASVSPNDVIRYRKQTVMRLSRFLQLAMTFRKSVVFDIFPPHSNHTHRDNYTQTVVNVIRNSQIDPQLVWFLVNDKNSSDKWRPENFTLVYRERVKVAELKSARVSKVNVEATSRSHEWITMYHAANISVNEYTVNTKWLYSLYWCMGVDSIISNMCHIFTNMDSPIWTMRPASFTVMWASVNCVSAIFIVACFIIQWLRASHDPTSDPSRHAAVREFDTETTFQSPSTMKRRLLPSLDSLDANAKKLAFSNGPTMSSGDNRDAISLDTLYRHHSNGRPSIKEFTPSTNQTKV